LWFLPVAGNVSIASALIKRSLTSEGGDYSGAVLKIGVVVGVCEALFTDLIIAMMGPGRLRQYDHE